MITKTIATRVDNHHEQSAARFPAAALAVIAAEIAGHRAKAPGNVPAPGSTMPDGALLDAHGRATTLTAARAGRRAVVVFYRGAWCPYCNIALRAYQEELLPELLNRNISLIAISPQKPDQALSAQEKNELSYAVLSDPGNQIAGALGLITETGAAAIAFQAGLGINVADTNVDGTQGIPMPTVVIVNADGTIGWIDVHADFTTRTEVADILKNVAGIGG